jgi:hypothetical protein
MLLQRKQSLFRRLLGFKPFCRRQRIVWQFLKTTRAQKHATESAGRTRAHRRPKAMGRQIIGRVGSEEEGNENDNIEEVC